MKYIKYLVVLLAIFLVLPFGVFAEDENNTTSESEKNGLIVSKVNMEIILK